MITEKLKQFAEVTYTQIETKAMREELNRVAYDAAENVFRHLERFHSNVLTVTGSFNNFSYEQSTDPGLRSTITPTLARQDGGPRIALMRREYARSPTYYDVVVEVENKSLTPFVTAGGYTTPLRFTNGIVVEGIEEKQATDLFIEASDLLMGYYLTHGT